MASELDPVARGPTALAGFQVAGPPANPCLCRVPHGTLNHGILYRILRRDDDTAENQEDQGREKDDERSNTVDRSPVEEETEEMMGGGTGGEVMGDTSPQGCPLQLQRHEQQKQHLDFQHYLNCQHQRPNSEDLELHNARQQNHETHCHLDWHPGDYDHPHRHQERDDQSRRRGRQRCGCGVRRRVLLRSPQHTWRAASAVLLKTARFVRNLPAFGLLPGPERIILLTSAWAPLFLLGLAQERVSVDAAEEVSSGSTSLLRTLLTGQGAQSDSETDTNGTTSCGRLTMVDIQKIRTFLAKFWSMDISAKEYGYLKGIVLFNPDSPGLHCWPHVQTLQREAQRALSEACGERPRGGGAAGGRLARLLLTLAQLHSIRAEALAELFFRPVLGPVSIAEVLLDMLDTK